MPTLADLKEKYEPDPKVVERLDREFKEKAAAIEVAGEKAEKLRQTARDGNSDMQKLEQLADEFLQPKIQHAWSSCLSHELDKPEPDPWARWKFKRALNLAISGGCYAPALYDAGNEYRMGRVVIQNFEEAYKFFALAARLNYLPAVRMRDLMAKRLTPERLGIAQFDAHTQSANQEWHFPVLYKGWSE